MLKEKSGKSMLKVVLIAMVLLSGILLVEVPGCMHGASRGFPFSIISHKCGLGNGIFMKYALPLENVPGTNYPGLRMFNTLGLFLDAMIYFGIAVVISQVWTKVKKDNQYNELSGH